MLIYDQLWRILEYSCLFGPTNDQRLSVGGWPRKVRRDVRVPRQPSVLEKQISKRQQVSGRSVRSVRSGSSRLAVRARYAGPAVRGYAPRKVVFGSRRVAKPLGKVTRVGQFRTRTGGSEE